MELNLKLGTGCDWRSRVQPPHWAHPPAPVPSAGWNPEVVAARQFRSHWPIILWSSQTEKPETRFWGAAIPALGCSCPDGRERKPRFHLLSATITSHAVGESIVQLTSQWTQEVCRNAIACHPGTGFHPVSPPEAVPLPTALSRRMAISTGPVTNLRFFPQKSHSNPAEDFTLPFPGGETETQRQDQSCRNTQKAVLVGPVSKPRSTCSESLLPRQK